MIVQTQPLPERIADRLEGQEVLVTGATGFLAKIFVEKLLRAVPRIGKIHLLVRSRSDGTPAEQRVRREILGSSAFDRLRAVLGPGFDAYVAERVNTVTGDLTRDRLGLPEDVYRSLTERVTLVVNSAATVTFDERLDAAVGLNIRGPLRMLQFAKDCGNAPFMHVSTAYVSGMREGDIPETLIPPDQSRSIDLDGTLEELDVLMRDVRRRYANDGSACRREFIQAGMDYAHEHGWNDTYTFTKSLAEQLLARDREDVPLVIFRPAIIEGSYEEPAPGWIDGLRMADPLILAFGQGRLKEFPGNAKLNLDLIPVDFVSNGMIATLPAGRRHASLEIYHCGSSARNPLTLAQSVRAIREAFRRRPMRDDSGRPVRVSSLDLVEQDRFLRRWRTKLRRTQRVRSLLKTLKFASRYRKRLASAEAQIGRLIYFVKIYSPYTHLACRFLDDKLHAVFEAMHPEDRKLFPFDVSRIDWYDYLVHRHVPGVRHFVLGSGSEIEAPMLAAGYAVEDESPDAPPPMQVLAALRGESIFDVFENAANAYPARIALQVRRDNRWVRYTYGDARSTTAAISRRFAEFGLSQGDHMAICCDNCPEWGLTYLAAIRSGLTVVPLDVQLPACEVVAMSRFADVRLICAGAKQIDAIRDEADEKMPVVELNAAFVPPPGTSRDPGPEPVSVSADAIASVVFTSGTTVAPKGVMLAHRNFLCNARSLVQTQPVHADDQFLSVLPMHHVFEFTGGFLVPISNASTVTYVEQMAGAEIVSLMQATGTTVMMVVPKLLKMFHDGILRGVESAGWFKRTLFSLMSWVSDRSGGRLGRTLFGQIHKRFGGRLRLFVCGGSALPVSLYYAFRRLGFSVVEGYGLTETAPVLTVNAAGATRAGSVGLPLPETELDIRHQDARGTGELWVRGPSVMSGYYKNEAATSEVIIDGWLRTGDLCRRDADGHLYVTGRAKDVIVTAAGKNVYPDEVALHYAHLPRVKELCVLAMPNPDGIGDSVDAVMVLDLDSIPDVDRSSVEADIRRSVARINERIATYQRIQNIHFWTDDLPKTTTLKVKRRELVDLLVARERPDLHRRRLQSAESSDGEAASAAASVNEVWLRDTLARLTKHPTSHVRPDANLLLDLGIDSLMKVELLGEIESNFGIELPDQVAVRLARVSDLTALLFDRTMTNGKPKALPSWKHRLQATPRDRTSSAPVDRDNGRIALPLLPLRWALRGGVGALFHSYLRVESDGLEHIPTEGAFILAANHASHLDSAAVLTCIAPILNGSGRRCYIAGAKDYFFSTRLKTIVFRDLCDTIPFDRDADGLEGLRRCGDTLSRGQPLLLFPEGTRSITGEIQSFKIGIAVLAIEIGVPIVPIYVHNTFELLPKGRFFVRPGVVCVDFGAPVRPPDASAVTDIGDRYRMYRALGARIQRDVEALSLRRQATHV